MIEIIDLLVVLVFCHLIGDYVLQNDFLAKTKGENIYHLFVHSALYVFPFWFFTSADWRLAVLFVSHMIIDKLKCKGIIDYKFDQILHYAMLLIYFTGGTYIC